MIDKGKILALKDAALEGREAIFEFLELELHDRGSYYNGPCPIHGGDNPTAFSITKKDLTWKCWTGGCHTKIGNDIYSLVRLIKDVRFQDAVKMVESAVGGGNLDYARAAETASNAKFIDQAVRNIPYKPSYYPEDCLSRLKPSTYLTKRGFGSEIISLIGGGFCDNTASKQAGRYVLPVRDGQKGLVGFTGRIENDGSINDFIPKWKHEGKLHKYMFGYDLAQEEIRDTQEIVLVEGPLKMMRLWEAGIKNCVAIFGVTLSDEQYRIILESGALTVTLCLDDDKAGRNGRETLRGKLEKYFYIKDWVFNQDIDKMSVEEIKEWMGVSGYEI